MTGALLGALGAGIINSAGTIYANQVNAANQANINQANIAAQMAINDANLQATAINNQTAINLANTAHQREVQDLRDAGLNPILSANGGGADVPNLSSPDLKAPIAESARVDNPLSGIASALAGLQASQDQHAIDTARAKALNGALPNDLGSLRDKADAEVVSATAQAEADRAQAQYTRALYEAKTEVLKQGLYDQIWEEDPKHPGKWHNVNQLRALGKLDDGGLVPDMRKDLVLQELNALLKSEPGVTNLLIRALRK